MTLTIDIPTAHENDNDMKALAILMYACDISTDWMLKANLDFVMAKYSKKINCQPPK